MRRALLIVFAALGAAPASAQTFSSSAGNLNVETVARGLDHPWGLAFLPDGRMLVTERPGRLRIVTRDGKLSPPRRPACRRCAHPVRAACTMSCSTAISPPTGRSISALPNPRPAAAAPRMARARLDRRRSAAARRREGDLPPGGSAVERQSFRLPHRAGARRQSAGSRIGDHFTYRDEAQNLANHLGKIVRVTPDGAVPTDNPFVGRSDAKPEIWSYGHRNSAGRRAPSADRQAVGARARPEGRRRGQHPARRQELRLARDRLRHRLRRHQSPRVDRRRPAWSSRSSTGCRRSRPPAWRSIRPTCSRPGRATCSSARSPGRCWCGSNSTARRS